MFIMTTPPPPPVEIVVEDDHFRGNDVCARDGDVRIEFEYGVAPSDDYVQGYTQDAVLVCYFPAEVVETATSPTVPQASELPATGPRAIAWASIFGGIGITVGGLMQLIRRVF